MRLQEFWSRLDRHFGAMRAQSVARDHVFAVLGGRSAVDPIESGGPVRKVLLALCAEDAGAAQER